MPENTPLCDFSTDALQRYQKVQAYWMVLSELNDYNARLQEILRTLDAEEKDSSELR